MYDPFKNCRQTVCNPYATDWEKLDSAFEGLSDRLGYIDLEADIRTATDTYLEHDARIHAKLAKVRVRENITTEMTGYVYRLYFDRGIYKSLLRQVNQEDLASVPCAPILVWLHDGLVAANQIDLLERLWRGQTVMEVSDIAGSWRDREQSHDIGIGGKTGEEQNGDRIRELATGWFENAIELFNSLDHPETAKWFTAERESLLSRKFLEPKLLPKPEKCKVDDEVFWAILRKVYEETDGDYSRRVELLSARLERLSASAINSFARLYQRAQRSLAHHDVYALVVFAYGTDSLDFYLDFCEELIWMGDRELVEGLVTQPVEVADRLPTRDFLLCTPVLEAINEESVARSGVMVKLSDAMVRRKGRPWTFKTINQRYPALAEHFGPDEGDEA